MNTFVDSLLISNAPAEVVIGLSVFSTLAALILLLLTMEQGGYRNFRGWLGQTLKNNAWTRRSRRKQWWLGYRAQRAVAQG
jgi:hypothetical protein